MPENQHRTYSCCVNRYLLAWRCCLLPLEMGMKMDEPCFYRPQTKMHIAYHPPPPEQTPPGANPQDQAPPPLPGTPPGPGTPLGQGTPPGAEHAGRYGQRAGGTHHTGMQSCCFCFCFDGMTSPCPRRLEAINPICWCHFTICMSLHTIQVVLPS